MDETAARIENPEKFRGRVFRLWRSRRMLTKVKSKRS